jgi:aconitate hydratase 2/2-methylisocitrate dehydratase
MLGRFPTMTEYKNAVKGINLTDFAPPLEALSVEPSAQPVKMMN